MVAIFSFTLLQLGTLSKHKSSNIGFPEIVVSRLSLLLLKPSD